MSKTWVAQQVESLDDRVLFEEERAVFVATELLSKIMEDRGLSKADLARLIGTSRANITTLLSGQRNMTIRTFARLAARLGVRIDMRGEPIRSGEFVNTPARVVQPKQNRGTTAGAELAPAAELTIPELLAA